MTNLDKLEKIKKALVLIETIEPGNTITKILSNWVVTSHGTAMGLVRRFITWDTRKDTYLYIESVIDMAIYRNVPVTENVIKGLQNIRQTYHDDKDFTCKIDNLIKKIENRANMYTAVSMTKTIYHTPPDRFVEPANVLGSTLPNVGPEPVLTLPLQTAPSSPSGPSSPVQVEPVLTLPPQTAPFVPSSPVRVEPVMIQPSLQPSVRPLSMCQDDNGRHPFIPATSAFILQPLEFPFENSIFDLN